MSTKTDCEQQYKKNVKRNGKGNLKRALKIFFISIIENRNVFEREEICLSPRSNASLSFPQSFSFQFGFSRKWKKETFNRYTIRLKRILLGFIERYWKNSFKKWHVFDMDTHMSIWLGVSQKIATLKLSRLWRHNDDVVKMTSYFYSINHTHSPL